MVQLNVWNIPLVLDKIVVLATLVKANDELTVQFSTCIYVESHQEVR